MEIKEIEEKNIWEDFLLECKEKTFLQSWNWGEFNKLMRNKIWRLGIFDDNKLISVALVLKIISRRGTFLLVPHGPNIKSEIVTPKVGILKILLEKLKEIAKEEKVDFIRISPIWPASAEAASFAEVATEAESAGKERNEENIKIFKDLDFKPAPIHMHPEASWKLDIRPSEEELLMNMRKTTRYLIKQAQKDKDIEIYQSQDIKNLDIFDKLQQEVVKTQHFVPFSMEYLKNELLAFQPDYNPPTTQNISLFFGKYQGKIVAGAFVLFWSNIGFYHHAALLPGYHKTPIAYLLQWEAIKEAKKRGCVLYDFWGYVDPRAQPKHPWAGPTLFKMGFGGRAFEYVKTQDFPLSNKYWLTYIFEKLRKIKRGL